MRSRFSLLACAGALFSTVTVVHAADTSPATEADLPKGAAAKAIDAKAPSYKIECAQGATSGTQCKVDKNTFQGWLTFKTTCYVCHGNGGVGSSFAPNLQDRFNKRGVGYAVFKYVVTNGYKGQVGIMPAWKENPRVMKNLDNLYRYLRARADGKLPLGRPQVLSSE